MRQTAELLGEGRLIVKDDQNLWDCFSDILTKHF